MNTIPIFITLEDFGTRSKHYIKYFDILNLVDNNNFVEVNYREGEQVRTLKTLVSAQDIHEAIMAHEEKVDNQFFGPIGE